MRSGIRGNDIKRFETKYMPEPNSGCWLWLDFIYKNGYGHFRFGQRQTGAHRASYELFKGDPRGHQVLHRCDVRHCVNPDHLFLGTHRDNMKDMVFKKRAARPRGILHPMCRLSEDDILAIRSSGKSIKELAFDYGVNVGHIEKIIKRLTWKHVA